MNTMTTTRTMSQISRRALTLPFRSSSQSSLLDLIRGQGVPVRVWTDPSLVLDGHSRLHVEGHSLASAHVSDDAVGDRLVPGDPPGDPVSDPAVGCRAGPCPLTGVQGA